MEIGFARSRVERERHESFFVGPRESMSGYHNAHTLKDRASIFDSSCPFFIIIVILYPSTHYVKSTTCTNFRRNFLCLLWRSEWPKLRQLHSESIYNTL